MCTTCMHVFIFFPHVFFIWKRQNSARSYRFYQFNQKNQSKWCFIRTPWSIEKYYAFLIKLWIDSKFGDRRLEFREFFFVFCYFSKMLLEYTKLNQRSNSLDLKLLNGENPDSSLTYLLKFPISILKRFSKIIVCVCFLIITFLWLLNFNEYSFIETDVEIESESGLLNQVLYIYIFFIFLFIFQLRFVFGEII